jgi:hypothetical protein
VARPENIIKSTGQQYAVKTSGNFISSFKIYRVKMGWRITNDTLHEMDGKIICTMSPDINPLYTRLIKKTPDIMGLVFQFIDTYELGHKMTKELYDNLSNLVEEEHNYSVSWNLDKAGNLVDNQNQKICSFSEKDSSQAILVLFVPQFLKAMKDNLPTFSSNDVKQKPLYLGLTKVRRLLDDY